MVYIIKPLGKGYNYKLKDENTISDIMQNSKSATLPPIAGDSRPPQSVLSQTVRHTLQEYFTKLDGHAPVNLHALVIAAVEVPLLEVALAKARNNKTKAAKLLGINRGTLGKKLREYKLDGLAQD